MKTPFTEQELAEAFPTSSVTALINECLHMGWPIDPSQGRAEVYRFLREIGFSPDDPNRPIDLYAALNTVRGVCWRDKQEVWTRYVESRRANVEKMSTPQTTCVQLLRTFHLPKTGGSRRVRLPLPITHPAQRDTTWRILSSTAPIIEMHEHPGALDLKVDGEEASLSVEIEYRAFVSPQRESADATPTGVPITGIRSPFPRPQAIAEQLPFLMHDMSLRGRIRGLWNLFMQKLASGHIHHSTCASPSSTQGVCFDCVTASWNFAECAETLGIPARVLSGVILNDFGPNPHFWCEVHLNGEWLPIDLYAWDLSDENASWASRFFLSLESRLRFELYPRAFSRFLPNIPWFIERRSSFGTSYVTYKCQRAGETLAEDAWILKNP